MRDGTGAVALAAAALLAAAPAPAQAAGGAPNAGGRNEMTSAQPATAASLADDLAVVRRARIYFYHHSVGLNLLEGVQRLDSEAGGGGGGVKLASPAEAARAQGPVLAHGWGGENRQPRTKIDSFAATLRAERALAPDLAFMKFCYVDFDPRTDVDALFGHYRQTLDALKREFPGVRFAHVTVPPTDSPTDLKSRTKRLMGLEVWADASNARRAQFSRKVRAAYPEDPVFDLAEVESTEPETGTRATSEHGGQRYPALQPRFTDDGGHLNGAGQRVAGAALIRFMAAALRATPAGIARQ